MIDSMHEIYIAPYLRIVSLFQTGYRHMCMIVSRHLSDARAVAVDLTLPDKYNSQCFANDLMYG